MRDALITLGLAVALVAGFIVQELLPPIAMASGARVLLAPVFFCFGACLLPFPSMVVLAFIAGFFSDFTSLQIVHRTLDPSDLDAVRAFSGAVELSAGWSILLFVASGLICQGLRPLVLRGQWWHPPLMAAATTFVYLAFQFAGITMRRFDSGGLFWSEQVAWRILTPSLMASGLTLVLVLGYVLFLESPHRRALRDF